MDVSDLEMTFEYVSRCKVFATLGEASVKPIKFLVLPNHLKAAVVRQMLDE